MGEVVIQENEEIVMKLLHYFITEKGYNPIVLHGAKDEIWLENMDGSYEIVRIVTNYIHNDEQLDFDLYKTKQIVKRIKRKTFSFNMNTLSLFINIGDNVEMSKHIHNNKIDCASITDVQDLKKYDFIINNYPSITADTNFKEEGFKLFMKITKDISKKNEQNNKQAEDVFAKKIPIVTYILIGINVIVFLLMYLLGNGSTDQATLVKFGANVADYVKDGQYYRLITAAFLHIGVLHLLCNMYCLYVIGSQIESFFGKMKYIIIYIVSILLSSLMSMAFNTNNGMTISAGASGAIFGLLGAILYFGYHYRVYLGGVLKSQIIPLIILNISLGIVLPGIDNAAHIGGLVGGALISMALGVKYKSTQSEKINGWIITIIFSGFLLYLAFVGM